MAGCLGVQMGLSIKEPRPGEKTLRFVSSNSPNKNADPQTEVGAAQIQAIVDDLEGVFFEAVAKYRTTTVQNVIESFGQGSVFVAAEAVKRGMADKIQTFEGLLQSLKSEINSMDYKALTAQALAENRPDLVAEFKAQGASSVTVPDVKAIRAEAITAERTRITAIEALAMPGAEAVITAAKAEGLSADATAVKIVQHMRTVAAGKGAAALANIKAAETEMDPPKASATDDKLTDEQQAVANMDALRAAGVIR
jgi:capsid assembly protease